MNKIFLGKTYFPTHEDNVMSSEGDIVSARDSFLKGRFRNLDVLLASRYEWMNAYIQENTDIIEIGAGAGFSTLYLNQRPFLTDAAENPWIDGCIDATNMLLADNSVDTIIASHNIHHFYSPYKFFKECERVLRPNGMILIREINTSFLMRLLLRVMQHEGWSYDVDVFDPEAIVNDKSDLWSANCAVPEMLFSDERRFENTFHKLKIRRNELCECLIFPLSGGVISKTIVPELPKVILETILKIDKVMVNIAPRFFALGRNVVIQKKGE